MVMAVRSASKDTQSAHATPIPRVPFTMNQNPSNSQSSKQYKANITLFTLKNQATHKCTHRRNAHLDIPDDASAVSGGGEDRLLNRAAAALPPPAARAPARPRINNHGPNCAGGEGKDVGKKNRIRHKMHPLRYSVSTKDENGMAGRKEGRKEGERGWECYWVNVGSVFG